MKIYLKPLIFTLISFIIAYWYQWNSTDLIWSFWITSLTIGYLTILLSLISPFINMIFLTKDDPNSEISSNPTKKMDKIKEAGPIAVIILFLFVIGQFIFNLFFFSIHFGGFHLGHGFALQFFFPHPSFVPFLKKNSDINLWKIITSLIISYWPVILEKFAFDLDEFKNILRIDNIEEVDIAPKSSIMKPYANVLRIHFLIFILAGLSYLRINQYVIYAITFAMLYFPVSWNKKK